MERLVFTLLTDGSSDDILIHPLSWLLRQHLSVPIDGAWADLRRLPSPPKPLCDRIQAALDLYPCDLLFVHRDAEAEPIAHRREEIAKALAGLGKLSVPVVPVRMQEAWLLISEPALRRASGNPNGKVGLALPKPGQIEDIRDPKQLLHDMLLDASELTGRRRQKLKPRQMARRLGDLIEDYTPLRDLTAFQTLETDTIEALSRLPGDPLPSPGHRT